MYHCQQSILVQFNFSLSSIFRAQTVFLLNMLVLRWSQRAYYWFWGRPKGHIRAPKGHHALWKRPSENLGSDVKFDFVRELHAITIPPPLQLREKLKL